MTKDEYYQLLEKPITEVAEFIKNYDFSIDNEQPGIPIQYIPLFSCHEGLFDTLLSNKTFSVSKNDGIGFDLLNTIFSTIGQKTNKDLLSFYIKCVDKILEREDCKINNVMHNGVFALTMSLMADRHIKKPLFFDKVLKHKDINVNQKGNDGNDAVFTAIIDRNFNAFKKLISHKKYDWNTINNKGQTKLEIIILYADPEWVSFAIKKFPNELMKQFHEIQQKGIQMPQDSQLAQENLKFLQVYYEKYILEHNIPTKSKKQNIKI